MSAAQKIVPSQIVMAEELRQLVETMVSHSYGAGGCNDCTE
jgi:hypothetical protein